MGNEQSTDNQNRKYCQYEYGRQRHSTPDKRVLGVFESMNGGKELLIHHFMATFGTLLGQSIWQHMREGNDKITLELFSKISDSLLGMSSSQLVDILMPAQHLIETCFEAQEIAIEGDHDRTFICSIATQMSKSNDSTAVNQWINENCSRMCEPIKDKIINTFYGNRKSIIKIDSEILSQAEMFILRQSLPTTIFWSKPASQTNLIGDSEIEDWTLLYSSNKNGLSVNRFGLNVLDYKGSSVIIFHMTFGEIVAIAADEEWRQSAKSFGGPNSVLFKFNPKFVRIDGISSALYCNFKMKTAKLGLSYGHHFHVNAELSDVQQIEVWGCSGAEVIHEQSKQKHRHKMQAERNARVPLPGRWEGDKSILEMAGVKFTNERRD